jgi:zinc protease
MRKATILSAGLLVLLFSFGCGGGSSPAHSEIPVLPDGMVGYPVESDPTVTFKVWFKVGSQNDPAGKEGLAYLTGQMLSDASTKSRSLDEIMEALYPMAASYGVQVDREMTVLSGRTHRDNLDAYFEIFTQAYLEPKFSVDDFERIRTNTVNYIEKQLRYASDEELGKAALYNFIYEGSAYALPAQGTAAGLKAITIDDVKAFYERWYGRSNVTLAIGGGYDTDMAERFQATVAGLPEGAPGEAPAISASAFEGRHVLLVDKPGADSSISFGFPIDVHRGDPDYYALWVANSWLGEHRNSSYGDYSYIESFPQGGFRSTPPTHVGRREQIFEVWIRTLPDKEAHFALRAAMREVDNLIENGMTEETFELTRSFLKKYILHFAETTSARLGYAVDDSFYGIDAPGHLV